MATFGQHVLSNILPPDVYRPGDVIDKKSIGSILNAVAQRYPDRYSDIVNQLTRFGSDTARSTGGASFGNEDLATPPEALERRRILTEKLAEIVNTLPEDKQADAITELMSTAQKDDSKLTAEEALKINNPLGTQLKGAGRGSPNALARIISSDLMYADAFSNPIPIPVLRSYSQGLSPAEHLASTFGARKGVVTVKIGVGTSGFLAKTLQSAAHRLLVTKLDHEGEDNNVLRGLPVDTDDSDNAGALLAQDTGPYKRNTVLTPKMLAQLKDMGHDQILVRSPLTTADPEGGVYARDVGYRENNRLPDIGSNPGEVAAAAMAEPLTQMTLCLAEGTLVKLADNSDIAIENIKPGMQVFGSDRQGNLRPVRVVSVFDNGLRDCNTYFINVSPGVSWVELSSTPDHKILTPCGQVLPIKQATDLGLLPVFDVVRLGKVRTYDIEVDHPDHLFMLTNGLIVSNSAKHQGGLAKERQTITGFELIEKLTNPPQEFREAATHAHHDGKIEKIIEAPQGGNYIVINGENHYAPAGAKINYAVGDAVEAGNQLTDGPINPREVVKYKGLGEGARLITNQFYKAMKLAEAPVHRRNVELVVRGMLDRARLKQEYDEYAPEDLVPYSRIEAAWKPRQDAKFSPLSSSTNRYLEQPILHYTIGTRITPSVANTLKKFKVEKVVTHHEPPPFEPEVVRGVDLLQSDPDWMVRHLGTGLQKSTLQAVHRGAVSDEQSTSFVPSRTRNLDFGINDKFKLQAPE